MTAPLDDGLPAPDETPFKIEAAEELLTLMRRERRPQAPSTGGRGEEARGATNCDRFFHPSQGLATAMSQRSIAQLIKRQVIHLAPSASVREAAQLMSENHIGALLVMDEGRLVGIFTERDVLNRVVAVGRNPDSTPLSEVMTRDLVVLGPQAEATLALHVMNEVGLRHLPVVENDEVYGIISLRDFVGFELHLAIEGADG